MKYEIRVKRPLLFEGQTVTDQDVLATIETDLPVREVLLLAQFGQAALIEVGAKAAKPATAEPSEVDQGPDRPTDLLAGFPVGALSEVDSRIQAKHIASLAAAGLNTAQLVSAATDSDLEKLEHIGGVTVNRIRDAIGKLFRAAEDAQDEE